MLPTHMGAATFDLFAMARANVSTLEQRFEAAVGDMPSDQVALVREFASWVEGQALISINVPLYVVGEFLNGRPYQNTYELAEELARLSSRAVDEVLRERLHPYYERRIAFDRTFKEGKKFRYGALYVGGVGLTVYGPYCIVLTRAYQESLTEVAYLPG